MIAPNTTQQPNGSAAAHRLAAVVVVFLVARLAFALLLGPGVDESYTLAISRALSLSYFDHPPLHQWIAHFAAGAFGEGLCPRLPFILLFAATGLIYYRLTADLFGPRAAIVAVFALNVAPFYFASAGAWIVPDGPLLFALAAAVWALARLFFATPPDRASVWGLWLTVGVALGFAGLSKYSAVLSVFGLLAFVVVSPRQRRWLADPAPYVAAAVALVMILPVIVWNARHSWVSFGFQGGRGAPAARLKPAQVLAMALGEIAYLSPWLFAPLVLGLVAAWRKRGDPRRLFLFCLALPPILFFTLTPLWGARGLPHWTMPGWFFVFALMGAWIEDRRVADRALRRWAFASAGLLAALVAVVAVQAATGWPLRLLGLRPGAADPTLEAFDWSGLRDAPALRAAPAFVLAAKWSDAGKIALALGPGVPVFVVSNDPRGWAFVGGGDNLLGRDGVLVARASDLAIAEAEAAPLARSLGAPQACALTRSGETAIELTLVPVQGLTRKLPLPYPGAPRK
jgi:4-amino-4-deoxy-L-arabinose transferase-like glycosyltransferase